MGIRLLRPLLHSLCCNSPWNYAVFWKFDHQHEMILVWEDGFCDMLKLEDLEPRTVEGFYPENKTMFTPSFTSNVKDRDILECPVGLAVAGMSSAYHVLGKGVVGKAACTGIAHWVYLDSILTYLFNSGLEDEYPDEWLHQIEAGIKTVLLLPLLPYGVLQLGSVEMVAEDETLVACVRDKFESLKEPCGHERRYPIQDSSLMTTFSPNCENVNVDKHSIYPVMTEDYNFIDENEFSQFPFSMIYDAGPSVLSTEDYKSFTAENVYFPNVERLWTPPYSENYNRRFCGDFVNGSTDLLFEDSAAESTLVSNDSQSTICGSESNLFSFLWEFDLYKELGTADNPYQTFISNQDFTYYSNVNTQTSYSMNVSGLESIGISKNELNVEDVLEATVANVCDSFDNHSSSKSNVTSFSMFPEKHEPSSERCGESFAKMKEVPWTCSFFDNETKTPSKLTSSSSSVESNIGDKRRERKDFMNLRKVSSSCKKRSRGGGSQKPRPRDRQLIQDRIKELREIVPNSEICSIDGVLDRTIKHMLFLRSVTRQAEKLRHQDLEVVSRPVEEELFNNEYQESKGGSRWPVELGNEQQLCPIVVKDLEQPGHMLIEMRCADHSGFLGIADVIHGLRLTILKGVMVKVSGTWVARFVVETSGSFQRFDIFWPLMQLLR